MNFIFSKKSLFLWLFFIIIVINVIVYLPSLGHVARSDHEHFFIETSDYQGFWNNLAHTYSYSRQRIINPGDYFLFKPLYFVVLCLEKALFGYNYWLWQLIAVVFHLGVVWQLFCLLREIGLRVWMRFSLCLLFSLTFLAQDMVTFQHMNVCLLMDLLVLKLFRYVLKYMQSSQTDRKLSWKIFWLILVVCLMRESGIIYSLCIFIGLLWHRIFYINGIAKYFSSNYLLKGTKSLLIFLVPFLIYFLWNAADYFYYLGGTTNLFPQAHGLTGRLSNIGLWIFLTVMGPFIPIFLNIHLGPLQQERVLLEGISFMKPFQIEGVSSYLSLLNYAILIALGLLMVGFLIVTINRLRKMNNDLPACDHVLSSSGEKKCLGLMIFLSILVYSCVLFSMRFSERGFSNLFINLYYFYPMIMLTFIAFAVIIQPFIKKNSKLILLFSLLCVFASILNGYKNFQLNLELKNYASKVIKEKKEHGIGAYYLGKKFNALGVYAMRDGKIDKAQSYYDKALKADSKNQDISYNIAVLNFNKNDIKTALEWLNKSLSVDPNSAQSLSLRGYAYYVLNNNELALADLNQVIRMNVNGNPIAYFYRAQVLGKQNQYNFALQDALKAQSLGMSGITDFIVYLNGKVKESESNGSTTPNP